MSRLDKYSPFVPDMIDCPSCLQKGVDRKRLFWGRRSTCRICNAKVRSNNYHHGRVGLYILTPLAFLLCFFSVWFALFAVAVLIGTYFWSIRISYRAILSKPDPSED